MNADEIAKQMRGVEGSHDIDAGRLLLREWARLESEQADFAIETALASRSLCPRIRRLKQEGYEFHLVFLSLPTPEIAIARVAERVRSGGHNIPEQTIRRRFKAGLHNLFELYMPLSDTWCVYLNVAPGEPQRVAFCAGAAIQVDMPESWEQIKCYAR